MEVKINLLENKINTLIECYKQIKDENKLLKEQLIEKEQKIKEYEENKEKALDKVDNLIEILKKEGFCEEN